MNRNSLIVMLLIACFSVAGCATSRKNQTKKYPPVDVKILAFNDLHGNLEGPSGSLVVNGNKVKAGGAEYLAGKIDEIRQKDPDALLVAAGDMIGASPMLSSLFHDEPTIEALNKMHLDVTSVGNHEFDEGVDELMRIKNGGCHPEDGCKGKESYDGAKFDMLAANVYKDGSSEPIMPAVAIKKVKGVSIGFIGLTLSGTPQVVSPDKIKGYQFRDEVDTINKYVQELRKQGVETIIVLIHEGGEQEGDYNSCKNMKGPIVDIVKHLDPAVDVVVSGHTHEAYICDINGILLTSAKSYGRLLTEVDLSIDPATGNVIQKSAVNDPILTDGSIQKAPEVTQIIRQYKKVVKPLADRVIGKIKQDIDREELPTGETMLGRVIADAQLKAAKPEGAQIAMMNPGGIRADLLYQPSGDEERSPGQVTYGQIFAVQPFSNSLVTMSLTGTQIHQILEEQFETHRMLAVSKGFSYSYKADAPKGEHVAPNSIQLNGKTIAPDKTYRVVANSFLAAGGDGFHTFADGTDRIVGLMDVDALALYVGKQRLLRVPKDQRLVNEK